MGDARFDPPYERVRDAPDRAAAIKTLSDAEVIAALAGASGVGDKYLANVLATEALNRNRRLTAKFAAIAVGAAVFIIPRVFLNLWLAGPEEDLPETIRLVATIFLLGLGVVFGVFAYVRARVASTWATV